MNTRAAVVQDLLENILEVRRVAPDVLVSNAATGPLDRIYGGRLIAQSLLAAAKDLSPSLRPQVLHTSFVRLGDPQREIEYHIEEIAASRNFTTRAVRAEQNGRFLAFSQISFHSAMHAADSPYNYAQSAPSVPGPEMLEPAPEPKWARGPATPPQYDGLFWPVEMRLIAQGAHIDVSQGQPMWIRVDVERHESQCISEVLLAYASDLIITDPIMNGFGLGGPTVPRPGDVFVASLNHTMWFHRTFTIKNWLLHTASASIMASSRGLASAEYFDRAGNHVASAIQEVLIDDRSVAT